MSTPMNLKLMFADYDNYLFGNKSEYSTYWFENKTEEEKENLALELIQYVIEYYLKWTPAMARDHLDRKICERWGLLPIINKVRFPSELDKKKDFYYVVHLIYPDIIRINEIDIFLNVYKNLLNGEIAKYPKGFFSGTKAVNRACCCLFYAIENFLPMPSVEAMYAFFGSRDCIPFLKQYKLYAACETLFKNPVEYFHYVASPEQKNELLFRYYYLWWEHEKMMQEQEPVKRGRRRKVPDKSQLKKLNVEKMIKEVREKEG